MASSTLWTSIRNPSGWAWALAEIKRDAGILSERGVAWHETVLHWALLGSLEASVEILLGNQDLLRIQDNQGRTPIDWAVEKIYFLREQREGASLVDRERIDALASTAKSCAFHALNWVRAREAAINWSGSESRVLQYALSSGELELVADIAATLNTPIGANVWLCGLVGFWDSEDGVRGYLKLLQERCGLAADGVYMGRPLGLHVAHLWVSGKITDQRAVWFHRCGARLDKETETESLECFCAQEKDFGGLRLEKLLEQLDL